ncbi:helix-turn-helix domain-containing protein [Streptomyces sp. NPDC005529]|uniref:helix-turn-helix domain-containing protein n=1 Tax=unclassified Streptomyces TaxID=2593676 RepID=UPI00339EF73E
MTGIDKANLAAEVREFLSTRRARITPEQAGLPVYGGDNRRVAGLRREEVALLAGMSVDYYVCLERGNLSGVSDSVLEALARALQFNEAERTYLYDLARAAAPSGRRPSVTASRVRPTILRMLDSMTSVLAYIRDARFGILAASELGRALYAPVFDSPLFAQRGPVNTARFLFLDPAGQDFWADWDKSGDDSVAFLRMETGRAPHDRALADLIGELSTKSTDFARRGARHDVKIHCTGVKNLHHPLVGDLALPCEAMELAASPGLRLNFCTPEPDSREQEALGLLAGWASTGTVVPFGND